MYKFSIGADPEVFVKDSAGWVSAHNLVKGDKVNPYPVKHGAVQVDGMALEFNIDPANNEEEFISHMKSVSSQLEKMIGDKQFIKDCSVVFDEEQVKDVPFENLAIGCMPDYDAYTLGVNEPPDIKTMMRTAGGHIHIGGFFTNNKYGQEHFSLSASLAKAMDKYVGVYSLLWDKDDKRRELYGKAGAFRPKEYGMEYRTLSNAWIFSENLLSFIYKQTKKAVESVLSGEVIGDLYKNIINNNNRDHNFFYEDYTALELMEKGYG